MNPISSAKSPFNLQIELFKQVQLSPEEKAEVDFLLGGELMLLPARCNRHLHSLTQHTFQMHRSMSAESLLFSSCLTINQVYKSTIRLEMIHSLFIDHSHPFAKRLKCWDPVGSLGNKTLNYCLAIEKAHSHLETADLENPDAIHRFLVEEGHAQLLNSALLFDEFSVPGLAAHIAGLKSAVVDRNAAAAGKAYFYQLMSPTEIFLMARNKTFFIPSFMKGHTRILDLEASDCPAQAYERGQAAKYPFNVIFEIDFTASTPRVIVDDEICLVPCYTAFEFLEMAEENELFVVKLKALPEGSRGKFFYSEYFNSWLSRQGFMSRSPRLTSGALQNEVKKLQKKHAEMVESRDLVAKEQSMECEKAFQHALAQLARCLEKTSDLSGEELAVAKYALEQLKALYPEIEKLKNAPQMQARFSELWTGYYMRLGGLEAHIASYLEDCLCEKAIPHQITKLLTCELMKGASCFSPNFGPELVKLLWLTLPEDRCGFDQEVATWLSTLNPLGACSRQALREEFGMLPGVDLSKHYLVPTLYQSLGDLKAKLEVYLKQNQGHGRASAELSKLLILELLARPEKSALELAKSLWALIPEDDSGFDAQVAQLLKISEEGTVDFNEVVEPTKQQQLGALRLIPPAEQRRTIQALVHSLF